MDRPALRCVAGTKSSHEAALAVRLLPAGTLDSSQRRDAAAQIAAPPGQPPLVADADDHRHGRIKHPPRDKLVAGRRVLLQRHQIPPQAAASAANQSLGNSRRFAN